jgi:hypothetical protein
MPRHSPSGRDSARRSFCSPLSTAEFIFSPDSLLGIGTARFCSSALPPMADRSEPAAACYCQPW